MNSYLEALTGALRSGRDLKNTLVSGLLAQPVAGLAGLGSLARHRDLDKAADTVRSVQDKLTVKPTSDASARTLELATLPFTALDEHVIRPISDKAADVAGPAAGTAVNVMLNMLDPSRVPGVKALGRGARTVRTGRAPNELEPKWIKLADTTDNKLPTGPRDGGVMYEGVDALTPPEGGVLDVNNPAHYGFAADWLAKTQGIQPTEAMVRQVVAQYNAAQPVKAGGLGLGYANTAHERAAALDYTVPSYHGSLHNDIEAYQPEYSQGGYAGPGFYSSASPVDVAWGYSTPFSLEGQERMVFNAREAIQRKREALESKYGDKVPNELADQLHDQGTTMLDFKNRASEITGNLLRSEMPVPGRFEGKPVPLSNRLHNMDQYDPNLLATDPALVKDWVGYGTQHIKPEDLELAAKLQTAISHYPEGTEGMKAITGGTEVPSLGTTYPLLLRNDEALDLSDYSFRKEDLTPEGAMLEHYDSKLDDPDSLLLEDGSHVALSEDGVAHVVHTPDPDWVRGLNLSPEHRVTLDPSAIRSRFAAFDPVQRNSPNILAFKGGQKPDLNKMLAQKLRESAVNVLAANKENEQ